MDIFNDDCFKIFPQIEDNTIDLFLLDLPFNQTSLKWDIMIDLDKMWIQIKRMMKPNANIIFFTTTKFGNKLIQSNQKWFRYDLVWEKNKKVGFLSANKMPLRQHEMVYIFNGEEYNVEKAQEHFDENKLLIEYSKKILSYINSSKIDIKKNIGTGVDHFFRYSRGNFSLPIKENYTKLTDFYNLRNMEGYLDYEDMKNLLIKPPPKILSTYNPQMTTGKPYKSKESSLTNSYYRDGIEYKSSAKDNHGERYPTSILNFNNEYNTIHRTQKPVDLCEWLIKTYSNENDLVMDFCMGSGTTGEACLKTNRKFIGIEKDKDIYDLAYERLDKLKKF